ncbi:hypothetical protein QJQ45_026944, partial [Haematococcus lacustris]
MSSSNRLPSMCCSAAPPLPAQPCPTPSQPCPTPPSSAPPPPSLASSSRLQCVSISSRLQVAAGCSACATVHEQQQQAAVQVAAGCSACVAVHEQQQAL